MTFSVYSNWKQLFEMKRAEASGSIQCLDGIRAISLLWIIFGHRYFDMFLAPATNTIDATEIWLKNVLSLFHTTFHLAVDTFFLMGGLLVTRSFMKTFDKYVDQKIYYEHLFKICRKEFNVLKIYFHRFLRYTPVLLFVMLFFTSFMPYLGSGPIFDITLKSWLSPCYSNWWSTILHVSTFTNIDKLCMNWTWYLAGTFL
jgi:peptidoglycan/LPS O-acetylase OafA/YrhL